MQHALAASQTHMSLLAPPSSSSLPQAQSAASHRAQHSYSLFPYYLRDTLLADISAMSPDGSDVQSAKDVDRSGRDANTPTSPLYSSSSLPYNSALPGYRPAYAPPAPLSLQFPSAWSLKDKCNMLDLQRGAGRNDSDAGAVRANHPIPTQCGIYYFEIDIISKGRDGYIAVGFSAHGVPLNRLPGWEPNSWGYHGDDGNSFGCNGQGKPYGPTFTTGDTIGCCINFITNVAFYTKNGVSLGVAYKDIPFNKPSPTNIPPASAQHTHGAPNQPPHGLLVYPSVGMRTPGEAVEVNFGQNPFKFDIESYVKEEKERLWRHINATSVPSAALGVSPPPSAAAAKSEESAPTPVTNSNAATASATAGPAAAASEAQFTSALNELVLSYLVHHGYSQTATTLARDLSLNVEETVDVVMENGGAHGNGAKKSAASNGRAVGGLAAITSPISAVHPGGSARPMAERIKEINNRQQICDHILTGNIDGAIETTNRLYPQVLSKQNEDIYFQLRCRKFIELMASSSPVGAKSATNGTRSRTGHDMDVDSDSSHTAMDLDSEGVSHNGAASIKKKERQRHELLLLALQYGQELQNDYGKDEREEVQKTLVETFSLLAYQDPSASPMAYLLDPARRVRLAEQLNSAILVSQSQPPNPQIETIFRQAIVVNKEMIAHGIGSGGLVSAYKDVMNGI
ncbi:hypothetical protein RI367_006792 [Sorochytrium milnesiophthora]